MRNDTQLKITLTLNEGLKEYHFDIYNKEYRFVGTVIINEKGQLEWYIFNKDYENNTFIFDKGIEENILSLASYIYGKRINNTLEDINYSKLPVKDRWERAIEYIEKFGFTVNYKINRYYNDEYANKVITRYL